MMDTGDGGHSAWFQSRVQVLVRSLRAHQTGPLSPLCGDRPKAEEEPSRSVPPPPPPAPRRPLQLGRSLASRWQQYSPGPLRRLKKFFSVSSEQEQNEGSESEGDDVRKEQPVTSHDDVKKEQPVTSHDDVKTEQPVTADVKRNHADDLPAPCESPVATGSKDASVFGKVREPQQDINDSVKEHRGSLAEGLTITERPDRCSQNLENKLSPDSGNIPAHAHPHPSHNNENATHSDTLHILQHETQQPAVCLPEHHDTDDSFDGEGNTPAQKDFNKQFYVLTAASEDEDDRECWQQGAMTQWRRTDNGAGTVKGRATIVQDGIHDCAVISKQPAPFQGLSGDVNTCHSEVELTFINRKLDKETRAFEETGTSEKLSTVLSVDGTGDIAGVVNCAMAQNADGECLKLGEGGYDKAGEQVAVTLPDMATSLAVSDVEEPPRSVMSLPSIVLDLPQTTDNPPNSSDVTTSDSGTHRHPKLQLQISPNCTQSPARKSPVTVQEWVDSLPLHHRNEEEGGDDPPLEESDDHLDLGLGAEAVLLYDAVPAVTVISPAEPHPDASAVSKVTSAAHLARESSVQSDVTSHTGSHCSSVESYLESRRPDPEEILLGLGFGGPVGGAIDTELSRIPHRFLQPSKVKGVAIDSFLRYQQDLIETFESGFCGYRGLTGTSHTAPSEIVAKIMEKLRERERENIPPASVASAPVTANNGPTSPSLPSATSKFSKAARHVLTRTTVLGALPFIARQQQQQQQQSVLTPDNRRFLDSQGSKSPEIPRKRMIIGHRSYTFDCDGDLIEVEPVSPTSTPTDFTPKPKPLVHKDSVLSTTTSLSFTSIDSDSDTDYPSRGLPVQPRHNIAHNLPTASSPKSNYFASANLSQDSHFDKSVTAKVYPTHPIATKRMSSTSVSSWESEGIVSPVLSCFGVRHQSAAEHTEEEQNDGGLKMITRHYNRLHSSPDSPLSVSWPMRYESIEEDVEVKSDNSAGLLSTSPSEQSQDVPSETDADRQAHQHDKNQEQHTNMNNGYKTESKDMDPHVCCELGRSNGGVVGHTAQSDSDQSNFSGPADTQKSTKTIEEQIQIQKEVISLLQIRRGSLKRQQRILDDDDDENLEVLANSNLEVLKEHGSMSGVLHTETQSLALVSDMEKNTQDVKDSTEQGCVNDSDVFIEDTSSLENSRIQDLTSHEVRCVRNEETEDTMQEPHNVEKKQKGNTGLHQRVEELNGNLDFTKEQTETEVQLKCEQKIEEPPKRDLLQVANADTGGDSFEMEEIYTCGEEEGRMTALSRAWSDSSGFLDGDCEMYLPKQSGHNVEGATTNSESSQQGGLSVTSSELAQKPSNLKETMLDDNPTMANVPSCTSSDILQHGSNLVAGTNPGDEKLEAIECPTDFSVSRSTTKCGRRKEIGPGTINQQNLPNSLFQELSDVNDWFDQCKVPFGVQPVSDIHSSHAALRHRSLLDNVRASEGRSSFITNRCNAEDAAAQNFPFSNKAVTCGKSAIPPRVPNFSCAYQDSSLGNQIPPAQPSLSTDNDRESTRHRTISLHSTGHKNDLLFGTVRRVRSAPHCLEHLASGDMYGSSWSSVSNVFSFCSDESIIHVGLQKAGLGRTSEKQLSDTCASTLYRPQAMNSNDSVLSDVDTNSSKHVTGTAGSTQYLKPCAIPSGRNPRRSLSDAAVTGLHQLIGELADRGWDITMGTDPSHFACHTDQQLLRLQGDAVRAGLAAYGRQLVGWQGSDQSSDHEVAEANKELQTIREVRDRIAAELRHIADLLEEQPPHRAASITGQMAVLLREQTRLCQQLEALNFESSPSVYVEPASCCSVRDAVRQENRRLQNIVEKNSQELKEIRQLLMELVSVKNSQY